MKLTKILAEIANSNGKKWIRYDNLFQELDESFDFRNIEISPIYKASDEYYTFDVMIDKKMIECEVEFEEIATHIFKDYPVLSNLEYIWNVTYMVGGEETQFGISDTKVLLKILKTVTEIVKKFIKSKNPQIVVFLPSDKIFGRGSGIEQKFNMYRAILNVQMPPNFVLDNIETKRGTAGFMIINKELIRNSK